MNGGTDFGDGHGLSKLADLKRSTHVVVFSGIRIRPVRAAAFATTAGLFAGTAPHQKYSGNY